jgi:hypothetical protein
MIKLARRRVGITTISGLALACSVSCGSGRGDPEYVRLGRVENVSYLGCLTMDARQPQRLLLLTVDTSEQPGSQSSGLTRAEPSTSTRGPWVGTRQLELVGNQVAAMGRDSERRVRVNGVLEEQDGTTGYVDQVQSARGAVFRQLRVTTFETVEGSCAIDPRNQPAPEGNRSSQH